MPLFRRIGRVAYVLAWPGLFIYLRIGSRTRVAVIAEEHILLVQSWLGDGTWGLPGGGRHRKESPLDGALREVREETSISLDAADLAPLASEWRSRRGLKFYCHFFVVRLPQMTEPTKQKGEITAAVWLPLAELAGINRKAEVDRALELLASQG